MKLQKFRNGHIYKERGNFVYSTESGKTERSYDSIKELIEGENGTSNKKPEKQVHQGEAHIKVVAETSEEVNES